MILLSYDKTWNKIPTPQASLPLPELWVRCSQPGIFWDVG